MSGDRAARLSTLARLGPLAFLYSARITPRDLEQSLARRLTAWLLGATRESARPLRHEGR
jgi:hypothetical protein